VVEISFVRAKWWCEEGGVYVGIIRTYMCGEQGGFTPRNHMVEEGVSRKWYNSSRDETSVGMYKLEEAMEKSCSDLFPIHQRKCTYGRMEIL
jgi:hypothetical protein